MKGMSDGGMGSSKDMGGDVPKMMAEKLKCKHPACDQKGICVGCGAGPMAAPGGQ